MASSSSLRKRRGGSALLAVSCIVAGLTASSLLPVGGLAAGFSYVVKGQGVPSIEARSGAVTLPPSTQQLLCQGFGGDYQVAGRERVICKLFFGGIDANVTIGDGNVGGPARPMDDKDRPDQQAIQLRALGLCVAFIFLVGLYYLLSGFNLDVSLNGASSSLPVGLIVAVLGFLGTIYWSLSGATDNRTGKKIEWGNDERDETPYQK